MHAAVSSFQARPGTRVYVGHAIPLKLRSAAAQSYGVPPHAILALVDDTLFASGKDGFVVTEDRLFVKPAFTDARVFWWKHKPTLQVEGAALFVNGLQVHEFSMPDKHEMGRFVAHLGEHLGGGAPAAGAHASLQGPQAAHGALHPAAKQDGRVPLPSDIRLHALREEVPPPGLAEMERLREVTDVYREAAEGFFTSGFDLSDPDDRHFTFMVRQHFLLLEEYVQLIPPDAGEARDGPELALVLHFLAFILSLQCTARIPKGMIAGMGRENYFGLAGISLSYIEHCDQWLQRRCGTPPMEEPIALFSGLFGLPEREKPQIELTKGREELLWDWLMKSGFQEHVVRLLRDQSAGILDAWLQQTLRLAAAERGAGGS